MDATNLAEFIKQNQIEEEIVHLPVTTLTVEAAAEAMNVRPQQIIKSLLLLADGAVQAMFLHSLPLVNKFGNGKTRKRVIQRLLSKIYKL